MILHLYYQISIALPARYESAQLSSWPICDQSFPCLFSGHQGFPSSLFFDPLPSLSSPKILSVSKSYAQSTTLISISIISAPSMPFSTKILYLFVSTAGLDSTCISSMFLLLSQFANHNSLAWGSV